MKKYLFLIVFLLPFMTHAREPFASEIVTSTAVMTVVNTTYTARATSTDPLYINSLVLSSVDTAGGMMRVYCGTTQMYAYVAVEPTDRAVYFDSPYKCTGSVWGFQDFGLTTSKPSTILITGFSMSDANFDLQSGGGGGGTTTVDVAVDLDGLYLNFGILFFIMGMGFVVWYFKPTKV